MRGLAAAAFYQTPPPTLVRDVMTVDVETVSPDADLFRLVALAGDGAHKRVPVLEDGKVVGLVTRRDVMEALIASIEARWGDKVINTYDAIAKTEGMHNPFSKT